MKTSVTFTRPADTTAYTAGDVVGGVLRFLGAATMSGSELLVTSHDLRIDVASIPSGMTSFRLHLYKNTPPSALADNAAFDIPAGDRASYLGYLDLGSPADIGSTLYVQVDQVNKQFRLAAGETTLYGYLVTTGAYTPTSAASKTINLHAIPI